MLQRLFPDLTLSKLVRQTAVGGAVTLLIALIVYLAEGELTGFGFGLLVIGVLGVGAWILVAPDELRAWLSGRQVYYGTGTIILIALVIGVAVIGYSFVRDQSNVIDLTEYQTFTISETSLQAIRNLEASMAGIGLTPRIVGFYTREELRDQKAAEFLLRQFVEESDGFLELKFVDPELEPAEAAQYNYGTSPPGFRDVQWGPLYLGIFDEDDTLVTFENIGGFDERSVATALLRLAAAGQFKMYFITGYLEYSVDSESDLGLSGIYRALPRAGINVDTLELPTADEIPADASAIAITGAQVAFAEADVAKIARYIDRGGRMVILTDPPYADPLPPLDTNTFLLEDSPFSQYLWNEFGVRPSDNIISDQGAVWGGNEFNITPRLINTGAEIMANFEEIEILMALVRSIEVVEQPQTDTNQANYRREIMMLSSDVSFGETSLQSVSLENLANFTEGEDPAGPLTIGVAIRRANELNQELQPRVVIIGDTDWLTNLFLAPEDGSEPFAGNALLWNNIVEWLTQYSEIATIPAANRPDLLPIEASAAEQRRIQLITLVLLPGVVLGVGVLVWSYRRQLL